MKTTKLITIISVIVAIMLIVQNCSSNSYHPKDSRMIKIENSTQYRTGKFRNKATMTGLSFKNMLGNMWKFIFFGNNRTPDSRFPVKKVDLTAFLNTGTNQLNATWIGHSSLIINIDGYKILTDPVFEKRVSFFGPTRFNGTVPLDIDQLPEIDVVIVSHNHYDHLNKFSIQVLNPKTNRFIVPLAVGSQLVDWGVSVNKITELDWWDEFKIDDSLMIAATPGQHFSGRGIADRDKTLWASWVIRGPHHKVYFSGDSGYFDGFKQIGERYGPFDITFLECGAYNSVWHQIHMFPEETTLAHLDLQGNVLHPIHWGTFNLSLHSWYDPITRVTAAADSLNIKIVTPIVGETTVYPEYIPQQRWWEKIIINNKK